MKNSLTQKGSSHIINQGSRTLSLQKMSARASWLRGRTSPLLALTLQPTHAGALPGCAAWTPAREPTDPQRLWAAPTPLAAPAPGGRLSGALWRRLPTCSWPGAPGRVGYVPGGLSATTRDPHIVGPWSWKTKGQYNRILRPSMGHCHATLPPCTSPKVLLLQPKPRLSGNCVRAFSPGSVLSNINICESLT